MKQDANDIARKAGAGVLRKVFDSAAPEHISTPGAVIATPYRCIDPSTIPTRKFLFAARHAVSGHTSATGAFGGTGKSSLIVAEGLAHCSGKNILCDMPLFRGRTWYLGLEDPLEEHQRRISAAMILHKIEPQEIEGRLFLDTADQDFVVARDSREGLFIAEPIVDGIKARIKEHEITLLIVDPFVASHSVSENDNSAIDTVTRLWGQIARETGCAVELVHHLRKGNGNEPSADDFRGASAFVPAVRSARLLATMTAEEAEKHGIEEHFRFFRFYEPKKNMAARSSVTVWRELTTIDLGNGAHGAPSDLVAAVTAWAPPTMADMTTGEEMESILAKIGSDEWRESDKAADWVGNAIADVLGLDLRDAAVRRQVKRQIAEWVRDGALRIVEKRDKQSRMRKFVEAGK